MESDDFTHYIIRLLSAHELVLPILAKTYIATLNMHYLS